MACRETLIRGGCVVLFLTLDDRRPSEEVAGDGAPGRGEYGGPSYAGGRLLRAYSMACSSVIARPSSKAAANVAVSIADASNFTFTS